ncbi:hypothetical protein DIPPA_24036 [Diplonema papillatum]|nr:hypothetical protein DIPPA_24036 [Diplonema papillatum]
MCRRAGALGGIRRTAIKAIAVAMFTFMSDLVARESLIRAGEHKKRMSIKCLHTALQMLDRPATRPN